MTAYEQAKEHYKDVPRPTVEEFINHAKEGFVGLALLFGEGFVLQAVEIAETLLNERDVCHCCRMPHCECDEYE
jgi:preprotein translocase subunit Sss1